MGKIILLGRCCRVTFDMIHLNLKEKTSLFEWVWSNTLNEITYPNLHHKVYDKSLYKKYITDICRLDNSIRNVDTRDISDDETSK